MQYIKKLDDLFDISHANSVKVIKNEEDLQFLKQQQQSRSGCIGAVDRKLAAREKRSMERKRQKEERLISCTKEDTAQSTFHDRSSSSISGDDEVADDARHDEDYRGNSSRNRVKHCKRARVLSSKLSAVLDRTNTSTRKATMILASAFNKAGCSTSSVVLSKSTIHRHRQKFREAAAHDIKMAYMPSKCVVHWDSKLLPDLSDVHTQMVDRLPVLTSSLANGTVKLLGVPKLQCGSG